MPNNGYGGNVGIGTLTPNAKLAVEGVTGGDQQLMFRQIN